MRIVIDTNILVSGLINPYGSPGRVLDLLLSGTVQVAYDDRILGEYESVLMRPKFGFEPRQVRALLDYIRLSGLLVSALPLQDISEPPTDPDDMPFAEVAVAGEVDILVTGNQSHFEFLSKHRLKVLTPAEFLTRL